MQVEVWMLVLTAVCAVVPWAFSIHAKVAVIASCVTYSGSMSRD